MESVDQSRGLKTPFPRGTRLCHRGLPSALPRADATPRCRRPGASSGGRLPPMRREASCTSSRPEAPSGREASSLSGRAAGPTPALSRAVPPWLRRPPSPLARRAAPSLAGLVLLLAACCPLAVRGQESVVVSTGSGDLRGRVTTVGSQKVSLRIGLLGSSGIGRCTCVLLLLLM